MVSFKNKFTVLIKNGLAASFKKKRLAVVAAVCIVAVGGGIAYAMNGGTSSSSTNETVIYSSVQTRTLQNTTVLTGTLGHKTVTTVDAQSAGFVSAVNATDNSTAQAGDALFALGGREAIAEPGNIPFFRSLAPGDQGADVLELKQILAAAGDDPGTMDDLFTQQTQSALAEWQAQHDYPSATPASPESVTVGLEQGVGYDIGAQSTAGLIIGPASGESSASTTSVDRPAGSHRRATLDAQRTVTEVTNPVPALSISGPSTVAPGNSVTLTVTASSAPTQDTEVYLSASGDAQEGVDYSPFNPVLTLAAGTSATTVTITALNNTTLVSPPPFLDVSISPSPTGSYTVTEPGTQTLTFTGEGGIPTVTLTSATTYLDKGTPFPVLIGLSQAVSTPLTIDLVYSGTAVQGVDYVPAVGDVTVPAGATQTEVEVPTVSSNLVEPDRVLTVGLGGSSSYQIGSPNSATVTIHDPNVPELQITGNTTIAPGATGTVTVTANQAPTQDTQVPLSLAGSAQAGTDYTPPDPVVTIPAGQTSASLTIDTLVNQTVEPTRYIVVSIAQSPSASYTVESPGSAVITISDSSSQTAPPIVTLSSPTAYLQKGQPFQVTIGLNQALSSALPIHLSYGGTAVEGTDYVTPAGPINVPAGQTALEVTIPTVTDNLVEADQVLTVSLATSSGYQIGSPNSASVTITSVVVPTLTISTNTSSLSEGSSATFTITANQAPVKNTSVDFEIAGTAEPGTDYVPLAGTALLAAGQTQVTVNFQSIEQDVVFEPTDMIVGQWPIRIGQVYVKQGDAVTAGSPILDLTEPQVSVTLQATPSEFTQLALGQSCTMTISGGQTELSGTISELDTNPTVLTASGSAETSDSAETSASGQSDQQVFEGQIEVSDLSAGDADADGATVSITAVTQQATDVLSVPIAAVKQNGVGTDVVRVIDLANGGRIKEVPVTTGLTEGSYVQVTGRLHLGETVLVSVDQNQS